MNSHTGPDSTHHADRERRYCTASLVVIQLLKGALTSIPSTIR